MKHFTIPLQAAFLAALLQMGLSTSSSAHIVLSQTSFETGSRFAAFFKVEHGCGDSPTISLRVQMPDGVTVLQTPEKAGWTMNVERDKGRVTAVTWRGNLAPKAADQFGLFVTLPNKLGPIYFPTVQGCEKGENRWMDIPAQGQAWRDVPNPAPVLQLVSTNPSVASAPTHYMAGDLVIEQVWSPATPNGATTGAAYLTIMNHGATPDTLLGGATPAGAKLDIHQMSMTNGIMTMRPVVGGVTIPAGGRVTFSPQSNYHFMVTGLKSPLVNGSRVPATVTFSKAGAVQVELSVAPIGSRTPPGGNSGGTMPGMDHH